MKPPSKATSTSRFTFVGGKGGVGKTTCAAALAIHCASSGFRTLVISTDPAPSLSDAFDVRLSFTPKRIPGVRGLDAVEIDAPRALERWLNERREMFETIATRGTLLDTEDVTRLLRLSLPGIDEIAALIELSRLADSATYDRIVVDTAPTGHTLRMLSMPALLRGMAAVFDQMQERHRLMVDALRGGWTEDPADRAIAEMDRDGAQLADLLRDRRQASAWWVTLPEPMAVAEAQDGMRSLSEIGLHVEAVVVNRITTPPRGTCRWCSARRRFERASVDTLRVPPSARVVTVDALDDEPRGVAALRRLWKAVGEKKTRGSRTRSASPVIATLPTGIHSGGEVKEVGPATRLVLFGGKGGVGKTTAAAAFAAAAADVHSRRTVLLLSTDPAHSLGDVLGMPLGDAPQRVRGAPANLRARELDAGAAFAALRDRYVESIDALFDRLAGGSRFDAAQDRRVMRSLIDLAPPGIDELVAIVNVIELIGEANAADRYDLVVIDTAPTGHALRLLEMPTLVQDWVKALMSILLKYQSFGAVRELGPRLLQLSRGLTQIRELLADPDRSTFIAVTRPAALPREETVRLLARLTAIGVAAPLVLINAAGAGSCARCRKARVAQGKEIQRLHRTIARAHRRVAMASATVPPPHRVTTLAAWRKSWRVVGAISSSTNRS